MNSTISSYQTDKKQLFLIRCSVLLLHLAFFFFLVLETKEKLHRKPATKIAVRTVTLDAPKKAATKKAITSVAPLQPQVAAAVAAAPEIKEEPPAAAKVIAEAAPEPVEVPVEAPAVKESVKVKPEPKEAPKPVQKSTPQPVSKPAAKPTSKPTPKPVAKQAVQPKPKKVEAKPVQKVQAAPKKQEPKINQEAEAKKRAQQEADKKAKQAQEVKRKAAEEAANKAAREQEAKQNALISDALSSLNRSGSLDQKREKVASAVGASVKGPSQITTLASDSLVTVENEGEKLTGHEKTYYDELVHRLKLQLKLPDFGDVKINLTLSRAGKVLKVVCVKAKSTKNRAHIEKMLPKISFPPFGSNFGSEAEHTFRLHLTNELTY